MNLDQKLNKAVDALINGRAEEAEKLYREVLDKRPGDIVALHHVGVIHYQRRQYEIAVELIQKSIAINQNNPEAYSNLGLALGAQGKLDEAIAAHQQAIRLKARSPENHNNLASALIEKKELDEAVKACRKAIEYAPSFFLAHYNLGVALQRQSKVEESIAAFRQAIAIRPNFPEAYCNLGLALKSLGKSDEAIAAYQKAIELRPNFPEAFNNLGQPLNEAGKLEEAANAYRQATVLKPDYTEAFVNLASTLRKRGIFEEALETYRRAIALNPANAKARIEYINLRRQVCDWGDFEAETHMLFALAKDVEPFVFLSTPSNGAQQLTCAKTWAAKLLRGPAFAHKPSAAGDRIRIGYLSADLRRHATAYLMAELFERHDRSRFEVFAYSYGYDDGSEVRQRLVQAFDHFIDLYKTPFADAARRIHDDKIDILIDLKGYTGETRTEILVDRPAPVQVNYLGYPGTMGADFIDYIVADPFVAPLEHQPFFSEKIVHLPDCYQPNDTKRQIAERTPTRSECGLPDQGLVFCSFNGSYKISPVFFDIWMRLLRAVPGSVLWLLSAKPLIEQNLRREAAARGVAPERLIFCDTIPLPNHLARHRLADLFLDTLPINAHTTASDALWAGLPVLTCAGEIFVGRVAGSLLQTVGLTELITTSLAEYEAKALELATNPQKLAAIKEKLACNLPATPLFDIERYTRNIETAYARMVEIWRKGEAPRQIIVAGE